MRSAFYPRIAITTLALSVCMVLIACGGGGGGGVASTSPAQMQLTPLPVPPVTQPPQAAFRMGSDQVPGGTVGQPYRAQVYANGGTPPYAWALRTGAVPSGLAFDLTGVISGTPDKEGIYAFTFEVRDSASPPHSIARQFTITIRRQVGRNDTIAHATPLGASLLEASLSPYADPADSPNPDTDYYRLVGNAGSTATVEVEAFWRNSKDSSIDPVLEIADANGIRHKTCRDPGDDNAQAPIIADSTPDAFDDECINDDIVVGENVNSRLEFQVPGAPGTQTTFYAHVLEFTGNARPDFVYRLTTGGVLQPLTLNTAYVYPWGSRDVPYRSELQAFGGSGSYTFSLAPGANQLPPGLTMSPDGRISGTPLATGFFSATLQVTDTSNPPQVATAECTWTFTEPIIITTDALPPARAGVQYSFTIIAEPGSSWREFVIVPYTPGLSIGANGHLSAWLSVPGTLTFAVRVVEHSSPLRFGERTFQLLVEPPAPLAIDSWPQPNGTVGSAYTVCPTASGGIFPYLWSVVGGSLPPGLQFAWSCISGTPTTTGTYQFTIQVSDSANPPVIATKDITLTILP